MAQTAPQRMTAEVEGEFVVFLIGMRINRFWKVHKWLPTAMAMPRILKELAAEPEAGCLGTRQWFGNPSILVQYWRSFEHLERYAKNPAKRHRSAWTAFMRASAGNSDVGVWHETYRVRPGDFECIYTNMPPFGLGKATRIVPASGPRESASGRMTAVNGLGFDKTAAHRHFAADCFNRTWSLIEKPDRTPAEDEEMIRLSHASVWHWTQREDCTPRNLSVGYWQTSRVHALLGHPDDARRYAKQCMEASRDEAPFFMGYAHEALARAELVAGNAAECEAHRAEAAHLCERIVDPEDRKLLEADLKTLERV